MKLWVDAQLPPGLAAWLSQQAGVESATHVFNMELGRAADPKVWQLARAADVIVVSKDSDFPAFLARFGPPPRVIWVTVGNTSNRALRMIFASAWPRVVELLSAGEPLVEVTHIVPPP